VGPSNHVLDGRLWEVRSSHGKGHFGGLPNNDRFAAYTAAETTSDFQWAVYAAKGSFNPK